MLPCDHGRCEVCEKVYWIPAGVGPRFCSSGCWEYMAMESFLKEFHYLSNMKLSLWDHLRIS